jgi:hypothetical protein
VFFASDGVESLIIKILACRSYRLLYEFIEIITQLFQVHKIRLATAYVDIKECAVTKEFCRYSLPVVSA